MYLGQKFNIGIISLALLVSACGEKQEAVQETAVAEEEVVVETAAPTESISDKVEEGVNEHNKPHLTATNRRTVNAEVVSIDVDTRDVGLQVVDGDLVTITVTEDVTNLDQVSVGDHVTVEYIENIDISVHSTDNPTTGVALGAAVARTDGNTLPATYAIAKQVLVFTLEAINLEANTFKLKGPEGNVKEYQARNPENLKRSEVGDIVVISHTEVMAVSVNVSDKEATE